MRKSRWMVVAMVMFFVFGVVGGAYAGDGQMEAGLAEQVQQALGDLIEGLLDAVFGGDQGDVNNMGFEIEPNG